MVEVVYVKDEVITKVMMSMADKLTDEQMEQLKTALYMALEEYEVTERTTDVMALDKGYEQYLKMFLIRKKTEGKSDRTIEQYNLHLSKVLQTLNMPIEKITENDLFCYLARYKKNNNVSNVYLDNIRLVFSSFFTWLNAKGYIPQNPTMGLEPIKVEKRIKKPLSDEDLEKLRRICERERDLALIEFLYSTGVRVSELTALNRQDIDFYGKTVIVYGKGSKERETYLTATSCLHLKAYLDSRADGNEALFVSAKSPHERITVAGVEKILKKLGEAAGVEKVHPHRFRRTMATNVLRKGMPLEEVKELLGHTKLDTTMIYCTVSKENVKHSHQRLMSA
jgi:site-specific recombinase XerD